MDLKEEFIMADEIKKEEEKPETAAEKTADTAGKEAEKEKVKEKTPADIIQEKDGLIAEMTDKYLRALAEMDNSRKRMQKEKEEFMKYTKGETISMFLPVVDNFERAVASADKSKDFNQLKKGIEMVLKQFEGVLKEMGVKEISTNKTFDPMIHHAIHKEHVEGKKDGDIIEVYQKGWIIDDKILRPATVKIAHGEHVKKEDENHEHEHKENHDKK
jgi:molecular chaperone GrpE